MTNTHNTQAAAFGLYWSMKAWDLVMIPVEGGRLPGPGYVRVPTLLFLCLAPIMGALYVMFLPVVGFVLVAGHVVNRARTWRGVRAGALFALGLAGFLGRHQRQAVSDLLDDPALVVGPDLGGFVAQLHADVAQNVEGHV